MKPIKFQNNKQNRKLLKAYLAGYTIVYNVNGKFKQVNQNTRLNASNEYYVLGC